MSKEGINDEADQTYGHPTLCEKRLGRTRGIKNNGVQAEGPLLCDDVHSCEQAVRACNALSQISHVGNVGSADTLGSLSPKYLYRKPLCATRSNVIMLAGTSGTCAKYSPPWTVMFNIKSYHPLTIFCSKHQIVTMCALPPATCSIHHLLPSRKNKCGEPVHESFAEGFGLFGEASHG